MLDEVAEGYGAAVVGALGLQGIPLDLIAEGMNRFASANNGTHYNSSVYGCSVAMLKRLKFLFKK